MRGASDQQPTIWNFTYGTRYIHDVIDRAQWRNTFMWHPHHRLSFGVEYNPLADDVHPLANLVLLEEFKNRPAIIVGTSSDRIGTPDGQAYYATISKDLETWTGLPVAPYAGISYGTWDDEAVAIGGLNIRLTKKLSAMALFDGHDVHPTVSWTQDDWTLGFMLAFGDKPGIFFNYRF